MTDFSSNWLNRWTWILCFLMAGAVPFASSQGPIPLTLTDALRAALKNNPQVQIQREQVNVQQGIQRQAAGQFDLNLTAEGSQAHTYLPLTAYQAFLYMQYDQFAKNSSVTNLSQLTLSANKELRNGILLQPQIVAGRITDNLSNRVGYEQGGIHFNVVVPLLRGSGSRVVTANEKAAEGQVDAAVLTVNQTVSNTVAAVAANYWNVIASERKLMLLRASEDRSDALIAAAQSLIAADRMPRSDLNQMLADKESRRAERISAEQQLRDARLQLALQMGVNPEEGFAHEMLPGDLPEVPAPEQIPDGPQAVESYIRYALAQRADLKALKKEEEASLLLKKAAHDATRPELDVQVSSGVSGLDEGTGMDQFFLSPGHSARGLDLTAGFTFRFPPARDAAAGGLETATAAARQVDLQYEDLARQIAAKVNSALGDLRSAAERARSTAASLGYSRQSLEAEQERLRQGMGSTINVITLEDRLDAALASDLEAQLAYAQALVQLRLATSTIVAPTAQGGTVDGTVFTTLPDVPTAEKAGTP